MTKERVLQLLQQSAQAVSGQQISRELNLSRAAVWKAVEALRREGYEIQAAPRRGYLLCSEPDVLRSEKIADALDQPWQVMVLPEVDSTNNYAKNLAAQGAAHGTVVFAEHQTRGRGRMGRSYLSNSGQGLYFSVVLRPEEPPSALLHLTAACAEAVCTGIARATQLRPQIKWPNDLVIGRRKLVGILTELSVEAETGYIDYVVVGVGINCAQQLEDFPPELQNIATSLAMQTGKKPDRNALAGAILQDFQHLSQTLLTQKAQWLQAYARDCITLGKTVQIVRGNTVREAFAEGIDADGGLQVTYPDGTREVVSSGEVSVRGMYGYME